MFKNVPHCTDGQSTASQLEGLMWGAANAQSRMKGAAMKRVVVMAALPTTWGEGESVWCGWLIRGGDGNQLESTCRRCTTSQPTASPSLLISNAHTITHLQPSVVHVSERERQAHHKRHPISIFGAACESAEGGSGHVSVTGGAREVQTNNHGGSPRSQPPAKPTKPTQPPRDPQASALAPPSPLPPRRQGREEEPQVVGEHHGVDAVVRDPAQPRPPALLEAPEGPERRRHPRDVAAVLGEGGRELCGDEGLRDGPDEGEDDEAADD